MRNKLVIDSTPKTFTFVENIGGGAAKERTSATIYYKNNALCVDFVAISDKNSFTARGTAFNHKLWEGDIVEILLTLDNPNRYLEVEVNPNGVQYAVLVDNKDGLGAFELTFLDWAPYTSSVVVKDGIWETAIQLPLALLQKLAYNKDNANINLYRESYDANNNLHLYALSPTYKNSFHVPSAFLRLEIKE